MDKATREKFDQQLEQVLAELPAEISRLLEQVTMFVDDHPSPEVLRQFGLSDRRGLCGLYTGIPLIDRSIETPPVPSDSIQIYREGILAQTISDYGRVVDKHLREQIRITVLHELGHHFGMTEEDLRQIGYG